MKGDLVPRSGAGVLPHCPPKGLPRVLHSQNEVLPAVEGESCVGVTRRAVCPCRMRSPPPHSYWVWLQESKLYWSHFAPKFFNLWHLLCSPHLLWHPLCSLHLFLSCGVVITSILPARAPGDAAGEEKSGGIGRKNR